MSFPLVLPQAPVTAGLSGHLTDHNRIQLDLSTLWGATLESVINVQAPPYSAYGDGVHDDTAAINAALTAANTAGGGTVYLPMGTYLVSGTISIPPYVMLRGETNITLNLNTPPSSVSRIIASAGWAPSSSTGIVSILSKTPGGWANNTAACGMKSIFIDGSANASSNLNGLNLVGPVYDVHLEDVFIWKAPHNGITASGQSESGISPTFPYHQHYDRVSVVSSANTGFNLVNFTDTTLVDCLGFANVGNNYTLQNNSNSSFTACRAEWSSARGFDITGSAGSVVFTGCTTDQNASEGLRIHAATGQTVQGGGIVWTGGKLHADGNGGTNNTGIIITGSTVPVDITGVNVESGQNVNNSNYYPATGIEIDTSSNITVTGSTFQGITTAWSDGGGNTNVTRSACIGATGNPNTQTFTQLSDLGPSVAAFLPSDLPTPLKALNLDPATCTTGSAITTNTVTLLRVNLRSAQSITNVVAWITAAGSGLTSGQNFAGLYNSAGTRIAVTADQTTAWASTGLMTMALASGPYTLAPGFYWVALLSNGGTPPSFLRIASPFSASAANLGGSVTGARSATNGTGTSLPSSVTPSSNVNAGQIWFAGLS